MERPADDRRPVVGLICNDEHDVFGDVAARLEAAGVEVQFFDPGRPLDDDTIASLSLLMNKKVDPASMSALSRADRLGVATWNGPTTLLLGIRIVGYWFLERVGFRVPRVSLTEPGEDCVSKTFVDWHYEPDPAVNAEGDIYQRLLPAEPVDHKYYAVDTGDDIEVRVLRTTSKLHGEKRPIELASPEPDLASKVRRLLGLTGSQALGVDVVKTEAGPWAVDVNPAMSFRNAEMVPELVQSVASLLARQESATPVQRVSGTDR